MLRLHSWVGDISSGAFTECVIRCFSNITTLTPATLAYLKQVLIVNLAVHVQNSSCVHIAFRYDQDVFIKATLQ